MQKTYYGNAISEYGLERGYVDYACLAKSFNHVLCNNIMEMDPYLMENIISDCPYHYYTKEGVEIDEDTYNELSWEDQQEINQEPVDIYQYYIVDTNGADILREANELVCYSDKLDLYVWEVTHYGTSWDYVVTNIKIKN